MESPGKNLSKFLEERDPANPKFWRRVWARHLREDSPTSASEDTASPNSVPSAQYAEVSLWHDVFVQQELPWGRFLQSVLLHTAAVALLWAISIAWLRQQKILDPAVFDRSSLVTYTPEEYLPRLDTGASAAPKAQKGNPIYARQTILSVPPEADNRSQTIVVPPDLKLDRDVPLPNIIATGAVAPAVPLEATRARLNRIVAPEAQVVAPAPEVEFAPERLVQAAMKSEVVAPPPELTQQSTRGQAGLVNIGPSDVIAPAPQLTLAEQHSRAARGGHLAGGSVSVQPVAPPPTVAAGGGARAGGRLIALGIHPVAPSGPVAVPGGNRRGTFAATPQGKQGAAGTPDLPGSNTEAKSGGLKTRNRGSLPAGLYVGAAGDPEHAREMASLPSSKATDNPRAAATVPENKVTEVDRQVFGGKRLYEMRLNMPNLNSASGSWVMKFAELDGGKHEGELLTPVLTEKTDPGYPLELMRANVHGMVTLYAVIRPDGKVGDIRVLSSPDERLDAYAARALARWKFVPAERAGKAVALETVVEIPFRAKSSF
jgi:TonB family protein